MFVPTQLAYIRKLRRKQGGRLPSLFAWPMSADRMSVSGGHQAFPGGPCTPAILRVPAVRPTVTLRPLQHPDPGPIVGFGIEVVRQSNTVSAPDGRTFKVSLCLRARAIIVAEIDRSNASVATRGSRTRSCARTAQPISVAPAVAHGRCRTAAVECMAALRRGRSRQREKRASWPRWSRDGASGLSGDAPRAGGSGRAARAATHGLKRLCASAPAPRRGGSGQGGSRLIAR